MYLNKAFVIGNLTRDPEVRALPSGIQVCSFSVATNSRFKDKSGAWQDKAEYHNIVVFGRSAETSAQYLKKGSNVLVEGRMQTRSWDDKATGAKKYRTEIVAERVQFGNRPAGGAGAPMGGSAASTVAPKGKAPAGDDAPPLDTIQYPEEDINTEDIPF
ncbi:MAG: single-stranded DNA-binding protein [Candidatus Pacebacteria bacterium]|nr:single-stranded DNA-binding protein [Candidatus Paceibacterota bacterium]MDD5356951.1 single-stranded DNA-binding protein [Candidatus Paceibacterota bacterium]